MEFDFGIFPVAVDVYLGAFEGTKWAASPFRHRAGWLMVSEARMVMPFGTWRRPLVAAISDHGEVYPSSRAMRLLQMPMSLPMDAQCYPPDQLDEAMNRLYRDFLKRMEVKSLHALQEAQELTDAKIRNFVAHCASIEADIWRTIRTLRSERRKCDFPSTRRAKIDTRLRRLLECPDQLVLGMRSHIGKMRQETKALEDAVMSTPVGRGEIEHLLTIRWTARSQQRGMTIHLPIFQEEPYSADSWRNCEKSSVSNRDIDE